MTKDEVATQGPAIQKIILELIPVQSQMVFNPAIIQSVEIGDPGLNILAEDLVIAMRGLVTGRAVWTAETEAVPESWWDHLKYSDALPRWVLRWFDPPTMRRITVKHYHICPHTPTNYLRSGVSPDCLTFMSAKGLEWLGGVEKKNDPEGR